MAKTEATPELPFSAAAERNRRPILEVLKRYLRAGDRLLEIGSGSSQHAAYCHAAIPGVHWQMTELPDKLPVLKCRAVQEGLPPPRCVDCLDARWALPGSYDLAFTTNTLHIMPWQGVCGFYHGVAKALADQGRLLIYGPFRYHGVDTAASNRAFDQSLRSRDPAMGLRDLAELEPLAELAGLRLEEDIEMPVNNRILVFGKISV